MKNILFYILIILSFACTENKKEKNSDNISQTEQTEKTLFDLVYRKIEDIKYFKDFDYNSSAVINYQDIKRKYAFVEMQKQNKVILVFEKIIETGQPKKKFQILDTIHLNVSENEFTSMGICQENGKRDSRIFTVIEKTKNYHDLEYFSKINRAWKANLESKKIEILAETKGIKCQNESHGI